jgi:hypothetical protein
VSGTFAGNTDASCVLLSQATAYGPVTLLCDAKPNGAGAARGDLVVAPETVIPLLPDQLDPDFWLPLLRHFQGGA